MKFYHSLYISEAINDKAAKIKRSLRLHRFFPDVIVITLCENNDQLEFFHSVLLHQPYYKKKDITIIGIAKDEEDAMALIQIILKDSQKAGFEYRMKDYINANLAAKK